MTYPRIDVEGECDVVHRLQGRGPARLGTEERNAVGIEMNFVPLRTGSVAVHTRCAPAQGRTSVVGGVYIEFEDEEVVGGGKGVDGENL